MKMSVFIREDLLKEIANSFAEIETIIRYLDGMHFYDVNTVAEDFICGLLNVIYDYDLENLNRCNSNYPGIDLGNKNYGIAVQVSSNGTRKKIKHTIDQFIENKYYLYYKRLICFVTGRKPKYREPFDTRSCFMFDHKEDILDFQDLLSTIQVFDLDKIELVRNYTLEGLGKAQKIKNYYKGNDDKNQIESRCISKMTSLGINKDTALLLLKNDLYSNDYDYIIESNRTYLVGDFGSGKSHSLYVLFLKMLENFKMEKNTTIPLFANVSEVEDAGGLEKWVKSNIMDNISYFVFMDGLDELEFNSAVSFIEQVEFIKNRYSNVRVLIGSRHIPLLQESDIIYIKPLPYDKIDIIYNIITGFERSISIFIRHPKNQLDFHSMIDRPLYLLIYAVHSKDLNSFYYNSDIDIISVFLNNTTMKLRKKSETTYNQLLEFAVITVKNNLRSIHKTGVPFDIDDILATGLITKDKGDYYCFPLSIVAQWLSAIAIKEGMVSIDTIIQNKKTILKWRYSLSIFFSLVSFDFSKELFSKIVLNYPAIAGLIINHGIKIEKHLKLEDSLDCGTKMQYCMDIWVKAIGATSKLLELSEDGIIANTLFVDSNDTLLNYSWSYKKTNERVTDDKSLFQRGVFLWSVCKTVPAQDTWPWIITFETIKERLKKVLKNRIIPVNGILKKELIWKKALGNSHKGTLYDKSIKIESLAPTTFTWDIINTFSYEDRVYYGGIKKMYEDGKLELEPPYPVGDKESKGGYIWSSFSKNRMLERIVFQYENGLFEYKKVVEAYFPNIMNTLSLYIALPTRIVGQLVFNENNDDYLDGQPRLTWYALPLNSDQHSIIDISYDNTVKIGDDVIRENIIHCLNHNRKDNKEFIWSSVISGFCFEATSTPITDWVYDKLYSDFKKIGWIDG